MTETEKMQAGLLYDANYNAQLLQARIRCKELCYDFNRLRPAQEAEQQALMRRLLGRTGERFSILGAVLVRLWQQYRNWRGFFRQP